VPIHRRAPKPIAWTEPNRRDFQPPFEHRDRFRRTPAETQGIAEVEQGIGVVDVFAVGREGTHRLFQHGDRLFGPARLNQFEAFLVEGGSKFRVFPDRFGRGRRRRGFDFRRSFDFRPDFGTFTARSTFARIATRSAFATRSRFAV
jgi:hypothetical protein